MHEAQDKKYGRNVRNVRDICNDGPRIVRPEALSGLAGLGAIM